MGGRRNLAQHLARLSGRTGPATETQLERIVHRRKFCFRQKGGAAVGKTKRGKGTKWMVVVDGQGVPLGVRLLEASPAEVTLVESTLSTLPKKLRRKIQRLIADRAYDSDKLRTHLEGQGIELICPHRKGRKKKATQDGRKLRRYRRRWKVERTFAWLGNFRRLVVRYERNPQMYQAFFHLACLLITLRHL